MITVVKRSEIYVQRLDAIEEFEGDTMVRLVYSARQHCQNACRFPTNV